MADTKGKKKGFFRRLLGGGKGEEQTPETPETDEVSEETEAEDAAVVAAEDEPVEEAVAAEPVEEIMVEESAEEPEPVVEEPVVAEEAPPEEPEEQPAEVIEEEPTETAEEDAEEPFAEDAEESTEEAPEEEAAKEKKPGLFARLKNRLGRTKSGLVDRVKQVITLHGKVDEELIEEIEMILVQADVGIETTTKIVDDMRRRSEARKADTPEALIECFKQAILDIVQPAENPLALRDSGPTVMLVVGVNGVGKTTTIGKLASEYRKAGKKVMMVAGDTFRAAAIEQLTIWSERTGASIVKQEMGADPASICFDAVATAEAEGVDVVLIDTAGRLHTKSNLMEELKKVQRVIAKVMPDAPHETLLVLDATTGQNAMSQAELFTEAISATGLVMTKLDGTAKGGILIALADRFEVPVVRIGIGEDEEDLRDFDAHAYVDALFAP